jgi:hypothetical protein
MGLGVWCGSDPWAKARMPNPGGHAMDSTWQSICVVRESSPKQVSYLAVDIDNKLELHDGVYPCPWPCWG